ncbi:OmpA family protein [Larkinella sp. VNQ87]|uniref:OmpA family protein n=1 Tax=Larkinella sp. VNQ87 TaxID=3400921 RepID=UPI003C04943A
MFSLLLSGLLCLTSPKPESLYDTPISDSLLVSGIYWDVTTGVDLKTRIFGTLDGQRVLMGESNPAGLFWLRIPTSIQALTFEAEGYPSTTVPVTVLGNIDRKAHFTIDIPTISPDSQQVLRAYDAVEPRNQKKVNNRAKKDDKTLFFRVLEARSFRRMQATVCVTSARTGQTQCLPVDSTRIPTGAWFRPDDQLTFEVRARGFQPYRGEIRTGSSTAPEYLCQIKLLPLNNNLAMSYDVPKDRKVKYKFHHMARNQIWFETEFPIQFRHPGLLNPGEEYEFSATTSDGQLLMNEKLVAKPGLMFMQMGATNPDPTAVFSSNAGSTASRKFFDSTVLYFDQSEYGLRQEAKLRLDSVYGVLATQPTLFARITGHSDNVGKRELNITLSEYRARAVAHYLRLKGAQLSQLSMTWKGPDSPVAPNDSEESKTRNRRVVIHFSRN